MATWNITVDIRLPRFYNSRFGGLWACSWEPVAFLLDTQKAKEIEMQKAKIFNCPEKCMRGAELKRLKEAAGLTLDGLAEKMKAWGWDAAKVSKLQRKPMIYLDPREMADLLKGLDATSV